MKIAIDQDACTGCGRCVQVCNTNYLEGEDGKPKAADPPGYCVLCGHCVAVCPADAITHTGLAGLGFAGQAGRPDFRQLMALLKSRRSRREFTASEVSREHLSALLDAAAQAPNGLNRRNVRYSVVTDGKVIAELSRRIAVQTGKFAAWLDIGAVRGLFKLLWGSAYAELEPLVPLLKPLSEATLKGDDMVLYKAPCVILIHTLKRDACGSEDAVYCGANILLAAEALGLGACVIGFLTEPVNRDRGLRRLAGIPEGNKVHTSIIVGHPRFPYAKEISRPAPEARFI
ncbi:MAG: nitroreductase family protein [Elusimicrobia bacterium]|nr:nitroreductase family protein [Elusimicrobiota bacterium]